MPADGELGRLDGQFAVVTGLSAVARATAFRLATLGANVALTDPRFHVCHVAIEPLNAQLAAIKVCRRALGLACFRMTCKKRERG